MLDARNIYRKVTRKIYDFSPEQMHNLAAIVWLYRGQQLRFVALVKDYLGRVCAESAAVPAALSSFETTLADLRARAHGRPPAARTRPARRGLDRPVTASRRRPPPPRSSPR